MGSVEYRKFGTMFLEDEFRDGHSYKWLHPSCCEEIAPEVLFDEDKPCLFCDQQYYPEESVLRVEFGVLRIEGDRIQFDVRYGGVAHYLCVCEEWELPLWDITSE